jgi:DNA invertase Pin-like site-specific DNA recombinase
MIIGYSRVSTSEQNLDLQDKALKEAGCEKIFSDKMSGARLDRPQLAKCLAFLSSGDTLVIWKLDRLGRSLTQLVNVVQALSDRNIGFKVVTAPIDTTTAQGKLIFGIFASLAEFERSLIRERVQAGVQAAKARGIHFGRPVSVTPEVLERARTMLETDPDVAHSVRKTAVKLGVSKSALYRAL